MGVYKAIEETWVSDGQKKVILLYKVRMILRTDIKSNISLKDGVSGTLLIVASASDDL